MCVILGSSDAVFYIVTASLSNLNFLKLRCKSEGQSFLWRPLLLDTVSGNLGGVGGCLGEAGNEAPEYAWQHSHRAKNIECDDEVTSDITQPA